MKQIRRYLLLAFAFSVSGNVWAVVSDTVSWLGPPYHSLSIYSWDCSAPTSNTSSIVCEKSDPYWVLYSGQKTVSTRPIQAIRFQVRNMVHPGGPAIPCARVDVGFLTANYVTKCWDLGVALVNNVQVVAFNNERIVADPDADMMTEGYDNCPAVSNVDQLNTDGDSEGNVCDSDDDNDGLLDASDNCPAKVNADQLNTDGDAQGDVCDQDDDNDGVSDSYDLFPLDNTQDGNYDGDGIDGIFDNCPTVSNVDQLNTDGDAQGNACDNDDDNDGVSDSVDLYPLDNTQAGDTDNDGIDRIFDNCPTISNADQLNTDGDTQGDACDTDDDNDGNPDVYDKFPLNPAASFDPDDDGFPSNWNSACDATCQASSGLSLDNCPTTSNPDQLNTDGDAQGNVCDTDDDNDGVGDTADQFPLNRAASSDSDNDGFPGGWLAGCNATCQANSGLILDNCPTTSNPTQANYDGDTQGDACDADDDNDGIADISDTFPLNAAESLDTDSDGAGNNADTDDDNDGVADTADKFPLDPTKSRFVRHDTEADGDSDVLMRSASTGAWTRYSVQNNAIVGSGAINASTSSDSVYVVQLDANGDGDADILTRSASTGAWTLSIVESGAVTSSIPLYLYANLGYVFVGVGDFNNDGTDDVMLRHATNGYRVFLLENHAVSSSVYYNAWIAASSVDQGIGDFNGDGTDDLLVRRTSDNLYFIFKTINGEVNNYYCACNIWANPDWTFQFAGDTNKDGIDDIVIRGTGASADGKWWAFRMNNFSSALTTNLNMFLNKTAVSVGAVGDYNGDGTIDVLTRVNSSTTYVSPIVNGAVTGNYWLYNFTNDQVIAK